MAIYLHIQGGFPCFFMNEMKIWNFMLAIQEGIYNTVPTVIRIYVSHSNAPYLNRVCTPRLSALLQSKI
jgi:hypothetical protein